MNNRLSPNIFEVSELRNRLKVFQDRTHAGHVLAEMLDAYRQTDAIILGIPAGGVPVAAVIATALHLSLDVMIVSKITLPWNTEAGCGAIAFDGTCRMNEEMCSYIGLSEEQVQEGIEKTTHKIRNRIKRFRADRPFPDLSGRSTILVDDGLASGFTMRVAIEAAKKAKTGHLAVAVPTGHLDSVEAVSREADAVYCPNIRSGWRFAVASAYEKWSDVSESEVIHILEDIAAKI